MKSIHIVVFALIAVVPNVFAQKKVNRPWKICAKVKFNKKHLAIIHFWEKLHDVNRKMCKKMSNYVGIQVQKLLLSSLIYCLDLKEHMFIWKIVFIRGLWIFEKRKNEKIFFFRWSDFGYNSFKKMVYRTSTGSLWLKIFV